MERENILEQDLRATLINQKWISDMTYIDVQEEGWCYLASVIDLHSKKLLVITIWTSLEIQIYW